MSATLIVSDLYTPFTQRIAPVWKLRGRRHHRIGYTARLNDDLLLVPGSTITPRVFTHRAEAQRALDEAALDLIEEAATTADLDALPFEPTAYELAELRMQAACDDTHHDTWPDADTMITCFCTSDGARFSVTTMTPAGAR